MFKYMAGLKFSKVLSVLLILLLCGSVFAQDTSKTETYNQIAKQLLQIGNEQYQRGLYKDAQLTLLKAAQYKEYLAAKDVKELNSLVAKVILKAIQAQGVDSKKPESEIVVVAEDVVIQAVEEVPIVHETPVDDLQELTPKTDDTLQTAPPEVMPPVQTIDIPAVPIQEFSVDSLGLNNTQESYIDVVNQKRRIQQSFTKAVVNDAITKAGEFSGKNEFARAKNEIARATNVVNSNKLLLGDAAYNDYISKLDELRSIIVGKETTEKQNKAEQRLIEARQAQKKIIEQHTIDRETRIADLMNNAIEYQNQQRYTEALGQLETLLAIDPTNRNAEVTKRTLEDTINLRKQLEVKRQSEQQEIDLFYETQRSTIPHAEDMTFPSNWLELTKKRADKMLGGLGPLDAAVYKQLDTIVDLSALHPDMSLDEAIEEVRNSIEPPLKLTVRWRDLSDNAYIERDTTIGMRGLSDIPLGKGLDELLKSVSGGIAEIQYAVDQGIITVATREALPGKMITDIYDVTELIGVKARFTVDLDVDVSSGGGGGRGGGGGGGGDIVQATDQLTGTEDIENIASIIETIRQTIEPESWFINGGQGSIIAHGNTLIIRQTLEIHEEIRKLITNLRKSLGQQIAIEARFLFVSENFLEDIGIDADISLLPFGNFTTRLDFEQGSSDFTGPGSSKIPGSLATSIAGKPALGLAGVMYNSILDDFSVSIMLRATQAHVDSKTLTAPKVTVLSGETAYIAITKGTAYVSDYDFQDITSSGDNQPTRVIADPEISTTTGGVILNVTPTISSDKRYVLLAISTSFAENDLQDFTVFSEQTGEGFPIQLPVVERAQIQTRVSIPDRGTLLIGGQKLSAEVNKEAGVPGMSKIPLIGRLFSNRSKIKDQRVLLILVKPTIILQDEAEQDAFAPLE